MKIRIAFLLILFSISFCSFAQTSVYHPFPDSNAVWRLDWTEICDFSTVPYFRCYSDYQYIIRGDTFAIGKHYNKIYREGWWSYCLTSHPPDSCQAPVFTSDYYAAIRNDTASKKIYEFIHDTTEMVLYDFGLNIGDSVQSLSCPWNVVTNIDSVLVGNNYRKRFELNHMNYMVEGIGNIGIFNYGWGDLFNCDACVCPSYWSFRCFSENNLVLFGDTNCSVLSTVKNTDEPLPFAVYPNPTHSTIVVESKNNMLNSEFKIYNIWGRLILYHKLISPATTFDCSNFPAGLYFYQIIEDNKTTKSGKLIKE